MKPVVKKMMSPLRYPLFGACAALILAAASTLSAAVEHLVVVGCDGMSAEGVRRVDPPVMHELMRTGAYTSHARGVMPTSSSSQSSPIERLDAW